MGTLARNGLKSHVNKDYFAPRGIESDCFGSCTLWRKKKVRDRSGSLSKKSMFEQEEYALHTNNLVQLKKVLKYQMYQTCAVSNFCCKLSQNIYIFLVVFRSLEDNLLVFIF